MNGVSYNYDWFDECGTIQLSDFSKNQLTSLGTDLVVVARRTHQIVISDSTLSAEDVAVLAQLHQVYELQVLDSQLPDIFPELLSDMAKLAAVDLTGSTWGGGTTPKLSKFLTLTHLGLSQQSLTDDFINEIARTRNLYQLRVDVTGFGVAEIVRLALRLRNTLGISVLDIDGDLRDGDTWEQLLAELSIANLVARIQPSTKGIRITTHESRFVSDGKGDNGKGDKSN
jgi:hypothetical protein